ncbi:hypothetical protein KKC94_00410 [Patescibacteria group bacterium]|nr:hypothetical protein [Patescibacteria group bacterium]
MKKFRSTFVLFSSICIVAVMFNGIIQMAVGLYDIDPPPNDPEAYTQNVLKLPSLIIGDAAVADYLSNRGDVIVAGDVFVRGSLLTDQLYLQGGTDLVFSGPIDGAADQHNFGTYYLVESSCTYCPTESGTAFNQMKRFSVSCDDDDEMIACLAFQETTSGRMLGTSAPFSPPNVICNGFTSTSPMKVQAICYSPDATNHIPMN